MSEEQLFVKRIQDLADMAYSRGIAVFTGFLNLNELHMVNSQKKEDLGVDFQSYGGYDFAERQMVAFLPDALSYDWEYPISCIFIKNKSGKFAKKLTHRDYLGALIHLGIERSTLGDILVREEGAYVFCQERMAAFILENLTRVKSDTVFPQVIDNPVDLPKPRFQEVTGSVSSIRLDSVLAVAFSSSRSGLVSNIENGNVFVNGKMITSNGYQLKEGDIISLRGKGKFKFSQIKGQSKKGRHQILVEKYV